MLGPSFGVVHAKLSGPRRLRRTHRITRHQFGEPGLSTKRTLRRLIAGDISPLNDKALLWLYEMVLSVSVQFSCTPVLRGTLLVGA